MSACMVIVYAVDFTVYGSDDTVRPAKHWLCSVLCADLNKYYSYM